MARITLENVAHSYQAKPKGPEDYVFKRIDTVWDDGGAYALLGPSGCGKTTMLNLISGLLTPSQGRIFYGENDVTRFTPEKRNIAQVFQFPVLYDTMTVFENLAFPLRNRGIAENDVKKRVTEVADILDLTQFLQRRAANLTADAKQKISLGRGLVRKDVAAILFDEPLTVIDPHLKWQLRRKLKDIHKEFKLTLIYVTHDQVEAMTFAEKVVIMYEGELVQTGTPEELFESPEHTFVGYFIGSPGMNFLDCTLDGDIAVANGSRIPLDKAYAAKAATKGGSFKIGIRPMYVEIHAGDIPDGFDARIKGVEDQGAFKVVTLEFGKYTVKARTKDEQQLPDSGCKLRFPPEKINIYSDDKLVK